MNKTVNLQGFLVLMMASSKIEWTDMVWNPVTGCTKVSAGCKNCYAETFAGRKMGGWKDRKFSEVKFYEDRLSIPSKRKKPTRFFVNSMSDLFHEKVSVLDIDKVSFSVESQVPKPRYFGNGVMVVDTTTAMFFEFPKSISHKILQNLNRRVKITIELPDDEDFV